MNLYNFLLFRNPKQCMPIMFFFSTIRLHRFHGYVNRYFPLAFLHSVCALSVRITKRSLVVICPRHFDYRLLNLKNSASLAHISFTLSLLTCSLRDILNIYFEKPNSRFFKSNLQLFRNFP